MRSRNRWILLAALLVAGLIVGGIVLLRKHASTAALTASTSGARTPELDAAPAASQRAATDPITPPSRPQTRIRVIEFGTSTPIPAASIRIEPAHSDDIQLVTDEQGFAHCDTALLEESWIEIRAPHYSSVRNPILESPTSDLEFALFQTGDLLVHVRNENGAPIPRAPVIPALIEPKITQAQRDAIVATWPNWLLPKSDPFTDPSGDKRFTDLPRGLKILVTALGVAAEVTLDRTTPLTHLEIVVPLDRCIRGRFVWEDKTPVTELLGVECTDPEAGGRFRATSQKDGTFSLCGVPAGRVNWYVLYPGELTRCTTTTAGTVDVGDIVLKRALECHGRVHLSDLPPDFSYRTEYVDAWQGGRSLNGSGFVQKDGSFTLRIPPGPASLCVRMSQVPTKTVDVVSPFDGLVIDLDGYMGRVRIDNVPFSKGTRVSVQMHNEPAVGSSDRRERPRSRRYDMTMGPDDAPMHWCESSLCIEDVTPGEADVYATDKQDVWFFGHVNVVAGHEAVLDAALVKAGRIRVRVHDSANHPVEGIEVEARPSVFLREGYSVRRGTTSADGQTELSDIVAGRWIVYPRARGEYSDDAQVVDIVSGATAPIEMLVGASGSIAGTVTQGNEPASGIHVSLILADSSHTATHANLGPMITDAQGKYRFDRVLPGHYSLLFGRKVKSNPQVRYTSRVVDLKSGEAIVCDVDLDGSYRQIVFEREGQAWGGVDAAWVYTPDGFHSVEARPEFEGAWGASIRSAPCVFEITSMDIATFDNSLSAREMFYAVVPAIDTSLAPVVVDVRGGRIDVHLAAENAQLPFARMRAIDGCPITRAFLSREKLAHVDAGGVRSFAHLPVGARVVLESDEGLPGAVELEVHVASEGTIDVTWPPH